MAKVTEFHY